VHNDNCTKHRRRFGNISRLGGVFTYAYFTILNTLRETPTQASAKTKKKFDLEIIQSYAHIGKILELIGDAGFKIIDALGKITCISG